MRKVATWFCMFRLTLQRAFCRPIFILFLVIFPIASAALHHIEKQDSGLIAAALYTGGDAWNQEIAQKLEADKDSFNFYLCDTEEMAKKDVMKGQAECAYLFPDNLKERLDSGNYKNAVTVLISPSTVAEKIISEKVFSVLFEVYGRELLADYGKNGAAFQNVMKNLKSSKEQEDTVAELLKLYDKFKSDGSTFSFNYRTLQGDNKSNATSMKVVFPVRGIAAVFIFIMGLAAAVMAGEDSENGLYAAVRDSEKRFLQTAEIAAFTFMTAISAFAALLCSGNVNGLPYEVVNLTIYIVAVTAYSFLCLMIFKKPGPVAALIPVFILGCILICPIFFDISVFFPESVILRKILPPWWYLRITMS